MIRTYGKMAVANQNKTSLENHYLNVNFLSWLVVVLW